MLGSLLVYAISSESVDYQPMNANYGLLEYTEAFRAKRKRERKEQAILMSDHFMDKWQDLYESYCRQYGLKS